MPESYFWQAIDVVESPPRISRHCLAYDQKCGGMVLFGGMFFRNRPNDWNQCQSLGETWLLEGNRWSIVDVGRSRPVDRQRAAMVYDPVRESCVLFGGQKVTFGAAPVLGDTYLFQDRQWRKLGLWPWQRPPNRFGHCMAFDENIGETVLFGGAISDDRSIGDTWTFDGVRWEKLKTPGPPRRRYAAFAYDPGLKGCLLQGGALDDFGNQIYDDTWLLRDRIWERLPNHEIGEGRDDHSMFYDKRLKQTLLTTGKSGSALLVRGRTGWESIPNFENEMPVQCSPVVFDYSRSLPVMFGGEDDDQQFGHTITLGVE